LPLLLFVADVLDCRRWMTEMIRLVHHRSYYQLSKITAKMISSSGLDHIRKKGRSEGQKQWRFGEFDKVQCRRRMREYGVSMRTPGISVLQN
jgi:hypothetical protein